MGCSCKCCITYGPRPAEAIERKPLTIEGLDTIIHADCRAEIEGLALEVNVVRARVVDIADNICGIQEVAPTVELLDRIEAKALPIYFDSALTKLQNELEEYRLRFAHYHVAGPSGGLASCAKCGLDIRNPIHFTEWVQRRERRTQDV